MRVPETIQKGSIDVINRHWEKKAQPALLPRTKKSIEVYDPIYGYIELEEDEVFLLDLPPLQRLRRISQLGLSNLVFPGATETRFSHSIGVFHIVKETLDRLKKKKLDCKIGDIEEKTLRYAALLHDICHFPFSHQTEIILKGNYPKDNDRDHEKLGALFVNGSYFKAVFDIIRDRYKVDICLDLLSNSIRGTGENCLVSLINSPFIDADKMDYLLRDTHFTGVPFGKIDIDRLIRTISICRDKETGDYLMGVEEKGLSALESLYVGRSLMYKTVYYHHTNRATQNMLARATHSMLMQYKMPVINLLLYNDDMVLSKLTRSNEYAKDVSERLLTRNLLKRLEEFRLQDINGLNFSKFTERRLCDIIDCENETAKDLALDKGYLIFDFLKPPETKTVDYPILLPTGGFKPLKDKSSIVLGAIEEERLNWRSYLFYSERNKKIATSVRNYLNRMFSLGL